MKQIYSWLTDREVDHDSALNELRARVAKLEHELAELRDAQQHRHPVLPAQAGGGEHADSPANQ